MKSFIFTGMTQLLISNKLYRKYFRALSSSLWSNEKLTVERDDLLFSLRNQKQNIAKKLWHMFIQSFLPSFKGKSWANERHIQCQVVEKRFTYESVYTKRKRPNAAVQMLLICVNYNLLLKNLEYTITFKKLKN